MATDNIARGLAKQAIDAQAGINQDISTLDTSVSALNLNALSLLNMLDIVIIRGTATDGLNGFLEDTTKTWIEDAFIGKTIKITIGETDYYPVITTNTANKVYFNPIQPPTNAVAVLGSGEEGEGQIEMTLIGDLFGEVGNDYSIEVVNGNTDTGTDSIALDSVNKVFTITVDTDGSGNPRDLMAGNIAGAITANPEVAAVLQSQEPDFTPGNIPVTVEPVPFTGGDDGTPVSAGDVYEIAYSTVIDTMRDQIDSILNP
jgi:hypothetical protein